MDSYILTYFRTEYRSVLRVTVVTVFSAIQQDKAIGIHIEARLWRTGLVNPRGRTQPFRYHLHQRPLVNVLLRHIGQLVPAIHPHPERLLLASAVLAADRHRERCDVYVVETFGTQEWAYEETLVPSIASNAKRTKRAISAAHVAVPRSSA